MALLAASIVISGILLFNIHDITLGQNMEYPTTFLEPVEFDSAYLRGSFNLSDCMKELMTCWELVRPDVVCRPAVYYESVCSTMRDYCHDEYGDLGYAWFWDHDLYNVGSVPYILHLQDCEVPQQDTRT